MNTSQTIALVIAISLLSFPLWGIANAINHQTTQAEQSLAWGQKLDCYWIVEGEKRNGKLSSFNMEECDY